MKGATIGIWKESQLRLWQYLQTTYPEVVATEGPDLMAIADHVGDQARTKVTSKVDSIAGFPVMCQFKCAYGICGCSNSPAKASTNAKDDKKETKWCKGSSSNVSVVFQGVDEEH